ncbi:EpsG family protein [Providencia sp. 504mA]|nr:EpsG family protein [Providencia rettgeri]NIL70815.1 EpsG family protein [Providencia sp. 504mA]NIA44655.1 EpsG family protein [Providencia rettgeri]NIA96917.1 EpsG family protein [Providencia rettgeri]NIB14741.1 EpsG family protein [Providencia rettgeri]
MIFIVATITFLVIPFKNRGNESVIYPFSFLSYFILVIFSGFRYGIGTDYFSYEYVFFNIHTENKYNSGLEYGFYYLSKLLPQTQDGFYALIFLLSLITNLVFYFAIKNQISNSINTNRTLVIILFFITGFYFLPFNGVRQGVAIAFILYSYSYIKKRKLFPFIICILLASLFHKSAILFTPIYFLYAFTIPNIVGLLLVISCFIITKLNILSYISSFILSSLDDKYSRYIQSPPEFGGSGLGIYLYIILFLFTYTMSYFVTVSKSINREFSFLFIVFSIGISLRIMALENIIFVRPSYYFTVFDIFFIPIFISLFRRNKLIISTSIFIIYLTTFIASIANSNGLLPYSNIIIENIF